MRKIRLRLFVLAVAFAFGFSFVLFHQIAWSQETTGGLQGTIKDPSGAVLPGALVEVTAPTLVGSKQSISDVIQYPAGRLGP